MNELRLLESNEISPIKIISHKINKDVSTNSSNTLFEVCDEDVNDKENKLNIPNSSSSTRSKVPKTKEVQSRYADTNNKKLTRETDSKKSTIKSKAQISDETKKSSKPPLTSSNNLESTQLEIDMFFCKYIQSLYINSLSISALKRQKANFLDHFEALHKRLTNVSDEINELEGSILRLGAMRQLYNRTKEKADEIEFTMKSVNESKLPQLSAQLQRRVQLVEVSQDLELGDLGLDVQMSSLDEFMSKQMEGDGVDVVEGFGNMDNMLEQVNKIVADQATEADRFQTKCIHYVDNLLKNTEN